MEDFFSRLHDEFVHVLDEGFDVVLADLCFEVFPGDESAVLQTLDVLAGDADVDERIGLRPSAQLLEPLV